MFEQHNEHCFIRNFWTSVANEPALMAWICWPCKASQRNCMVAVQTALTSMKYLSYVNSKLVTNLKSTFEIAATKCLRAWICWCFSVLARWSSSWKQGISYKINSSKLNDVLCLFNPRLYTVHYYSYVWMMSALEAMTLLLSNMKRLKLQALKSRHDVFSPSFSCFIFCSSVLRSSQVRETKKIPAGPPHQIKELTAHCAWMVLLCCSFSSLRSCQIRKTKKTHAGSPNLRKDMQGNKMSWTHKPDGP